MIRSFARILFFPLLLISVTAFCQRKQDIKVIAYFAGSPEMLDNFDPQKFTHIIYCFGHLSGSSFHLGNSTDTLLIKKMVNMRKKNPELKVLLSIGGWGGCRTCSETFSTDENRRAFSASVKKLSDYFNTDGIDLDWEYPTIQGYPGHRFAAEDKSDFTALLKTLRDVL